MSPAHDRADIRDYARAQERLAREKWWAEHEFRVEVFGEPRAPWRDIRADAMEDAIRLGLASWDQEAREHYLAVPVGLGRRRRSPVAFKAHGCRVTVAQRDAGLAVMQGTFNHWQVVDALASAGVMDAAGKSRTCEQVATRLLQAERRAGRIRVVRGLGRGMWERCA